MQKKGTAWHHLAMLASSVLGAALPEKSEPCAMDLAVPPLSETNPADPAANEKDPPKPLPPEIVKAWRDAGAEVGWMKMGKWGLVWFFSLENGQAGATPAFQFSRWNESILAEMPDPG